MPLLWRPRISRQVQGHWNASYRPTRPKQVHANGSDGSHETHRANAKARWTERAEYGPPALGPATSIRGTNGNSLGVRRVVPSYVPALPTANLDGLAHE
jgi:hypothetical protein